MDNVVVMHILKCKILPKGEFTECLLVIALANQINDRLQFTLVIIFFWCQRYQTRPKAHQDKGIPLCLPNNVSWDPATGIVKKTSGSPRSTLHAVPAAVEMLQQIKGVTIRN